MMSMDGDQVDLGAVVRDRLAAICSELTAKNRLVKLDRLFNIARRELRVETSVILDGIRRLEEDLIIKQDSRLTRAGLLGNETRRAVYFTVRDRPGISFNQVRSITGKGTKILLWHVSVLLDFGCIIEEIFDGRSNAYFTHHLDDDGVSREVRFMCAVIQGGTGGKILRHLASTAGASARDIEIAAGLSRQLVEYHAKRLEAAGIVSAEHGVDAVKRFVLIPAARAAFLVADKLCHGHS